LSCLGLVSLKACREANIAESTNHAGVIARPPILYLGGLIALVVLRWFWPAPIVASATLALYLGLTLGVLALCLGLWAILTMRAAGTNVDPHKESTTIVTAGPFGYTRNPIYVGLAVLLLGFTIGLNSWWGLAVLVPLLAVMHVGVILREERYLERKFGDQYRQYRSRVARYVG
jgi:protein-S-isoprenylcysteine O-methyltransferase Ste14